MCFREGSKMDIEELYRCVFNNVSKNQYDKAIAEFLEPFSEAVRSQIEYEVKCLFHQLESMELTIKGNREPRNPQ